MRLFKHGDSLAIVIPEKLRKELGLKEKDEFEPVALQADKAIVLVWKDNLDSLLLDAAKDALQKAASHTSSPLPPSDSSTSGKHEGKNTGFSPAALPRKQAIAPTSYSYSKPASISPTASPASPPASSAPSRRVEAPDEIETLPSEQQVMQKGYAVLDEENEAKRISKVLEKEIKSGEVFGIRGFDHKFYVVSTSYLKQHSAGVTSLLASASLTLGEIASQMKLPDKACTALLMVMKESGDIIEKRRGVYQAV